MKLLLTGGAGFTGRHTAARLRRDGHEVRCLVRKAEARVELERDGYEVVAGDLAEMDGLAQALRGCDALVNVASLGFGHAGGIVEAALRAGVRRAVFISTTAIFTSLNAPSKRVRLAAEEAVMKSDLAWTILRPTMIYGTARDRNMCRLIRFVARWPVVPVVGSGEYLMQPVHVDDVADAVARVLAAPATAHRAYNISGAAPLSYNEVVATVARALGRRPRLWHLPTTPIRATLRGIERLGLRLPIKAEQIDRLNEDKAFAWTEAARDFGYAPRTFAEGVTAQVRAGAGGPEKGRQ